MPIRPDRRSGKPDPLPQHTGYLSTQFYDSYQWYKAGVAIAGETGPTLTVDAYNNAAYYFKVEATLDGCTEMSPEVLVDGWAFLPPTVMTSDNYLFIDAGTAVFCDGDTCYLVLMQPYDINIQWTNNGMPIPGETDDTLVVYTAGNYHVSGAPSLCPDFQQQLGVTVPITFQAPIQPVIELSPEAICADPPGLAYQWYNNGIPVDGMDMQCPEGIGAGTWTVSVVYDPDRSIPSEPFIVTAVDEKGMEHATVIVSQVPANDQLTIKSSDGTSIGPWYLLDATGRVVLRGDGLKRTSATIDISTLSTGTYRLATVDGPAQAVVIMR